MNGTTKRAARRKPGRPTLYSDELAATICRRLAEGESLRKICADATMPAISSVMGWLFDGEHDEFSEQYAHAREAQAELRVDEIVGIADDSARDVITDEKGNEIIDHEHIARSRLRVDARKWVASKLLPKVYGDKLQHTGDGGGPIEVDLSAALTDALTKARDHEQRIGSEEKPQTDPLVAAVAEFYFDPLGFVYFAFPWGEPGTLLADESGPDDWQADVLSTLGKQLRKGANVDEAIREAVQIAIASGHGVGKTALVAWIIIWFLSTRPHPNIVVTANTATQLQTKTWRELAKWHKLAVNGAWFEWTATRFYLKNSPETWFAAAIPWSVERSEAFAGTHEEHILVIFDEASAVADLIWEVVEGAMSAGSCVWIAFGNPTRNTGRFRGCWGKFRHRWITRRVDARCAKKASRAQVEKLIADYGEDSDFVRIRVRGVFPRAGSNQLIAEDIVFEARHREPEGCGAAAVVLGVDVARFGDDQSVILVRQGTAILEIKRFRGLDTMQLAARVAEASDEHEPVATFVDGVGVGAGVVDRLRHMNYDVTDVNGGAKALDEKIYYNHRAEMWAAVRDWLKDGGCLPEHDQELADDLVAPEYGFDGRNRLQLEKRTI